MIDRVASLRRVRAPEFMAVIAGSGECASMVEGSIYAIPIRLLGKQKGARRQ